MIVSGYRPIQESQAMPRADNAQLNIRSAYARNRVREIARGTGMTATGVIEDALRGYVLPATPTPVEGLVRRGPILVKPAQGQHVTQVQADQALQAVRERDPRRRSARCSTATSSSRRWQRRTNTTRPRSPC
jgi:hypothetical protein